MAKIVEDIIIIKFSTLVKEGAESTSAATEEVQLALEQVAQELVGTGVIVEIERA